MVWLHIVHNDSIEFVDIDKIDVIIGKMEEKKSDNDTGEYVLEGNMKMVFGNYGGTLFSWEYNMGVPKIKASFKNQETAIEKWKEEAYKKAKSKHDQRIFKIVHSLEKAKNEKGKSISLDFRNVLADIDSAKL